MANVTIFINDRYVSVDGQSALSLRVFISKTERYLYIPLNIAVAPDNFSKERELIIKGFRMKENNLLLKEAKGRAADIILRYRVQKRALSKDLFLNEFINPVNDSDFFGFMKQEIENRFKEGIINEYSKRHHFVTYIKLKDFSPKLSFSQLTSEFFHQFKIHLNESKLKPSTLHDVFKILHIYIDIAMKRKLMINSPFDGFKSQRPKYYPKFLTETDLHQLWQVYNSGILNNQRISEKYHSVLRCFLFICNTGLRINDFKKLKMEQLIERNKELYLFFRIGKTANDVLIPLNKDAKRLIKDEAPFRVQGNIFETFSEQKMNCWLKEIAKFAKLPPDKSKQLSFNWGRHTFATLQVSKGVDIVTVASLMGHSKPVTTLEHYAHLMPGQKENAVKLLEQ